MFYSHEILTQRKYGIATVWLAATIGISKRSGLKKFPRKEILGVHIPKACDTVIHSAAPLALRLQSNLLVGISRVYLQQFDYLYQDVANVHTNIKRFDVEQRLQNIDLPGRVEGRTEQLVLRDHPGFEIEMFPEFELDLMLDGMLGVGEELRALEETESDVFLTPRKYQQMEMPGTSPGSHMDGGFASSAGGRISHLMSSPPLPTNTQYEGVLEDDPLFEFGEDGEMRDLRREGAQTPRPAADMPMSDDLAVQVMRELEGGDQAQEPRDADDLLYTNDQPMPDAALYADVPMPDIFDMDQPELPQPQPESQPDQGEPAEHHRAPRTRRARIILDETNRLTHSFMKSWSDNYLANMSLAAEKLAHTRAARLAKPTAATLVLTHGIGGFLPHPDLATLFSGNAILDQVEPEPEAEEQAPAPTTPIRRPSDHLASELGGLNLDTPFERARNAQTVSDQGLDTPLPGLDTLPLSELGRDAPGTPNPPTPFPWLATPTPRHSSLPPGAHSPSSDASHFPELPSSTPRRPRKRQDRISVLGSVAEEAEDYQDLYPDDNGMGGGIDAFEYFGVAGGMQTQDVDSQWVEGAMQRENVAFLEYVRREINEKVERGEEGGSVRFDELVREERDSVVVAAQGLGHVLLLATRGRVGVMQEVAYGPIDVWVV